MPAIISFDEKPGIQAIENTAPDSLLELLNPCDSAALIAFPVSQLVNSPRNDSPEILEPAGEAIG